MTAYFLKVNAALALFYAFYRLFCLKDTFFGWRRAALMGFLLAAALVPLCNVQHWVQEQESMAAMAVLYAEHLLPPVTAEAPAELSWQALIARLTGWAYAGGVLLLFIRFSAQLFTIIRLAHLTPTALLHGHRVHLLPKASGPFSFFRWIFVHPASHSDGELKEVLAHELTHARQLHSLDVVAAELACIVCWFNPFVWLLKREVRANLEYLADEHVVQAGYDSRTYQYHLLGLANQKAAANLYNNFNVLPLKKRITMMNKRRTREIGRTKYMMFLPLAALLMIVSNIETVARSTREALLPTDEATLPQPDQDVKRIPVTLTILSAEGTPLEGAQVMAATDKKQLEGFGKASGKDGKLAIEAPQGYHLFISYLAEDYSLNKYLKAGEWEGKKEITVYMDGERHPISQADAQDPNNPVFEVVEEMPEFPNGGIAGLMRYLGENIRYPEAAVKAGKEGRPIVNFIVERDGSISNVSVYRGVDPELDAEAVRVVSGMPKWKPGKQRGKTVRVKFTIPVMFKLTKPTKQAAQ